MFHNSVRITFIHLLLILNQDLRYKMERPSYFRQHLIGILIKVAVNEAVRTVSKKNYKIKP